MEDYGFERKETLLEVKDLCLSFKNKPILTSVNILVRDIIRPGVNQGQVICLLGPSGAGKSQTLRCLSGLQRPTSGSVLITDKLVPVEVGMVGLVAQNYPLFNNRTVLSNLVIAANQKGLKGKDAKDKAMEALVLYELTDKADAYPHQLSGGQRQRVAIAQQVLSSDHFLLMDEPFSGLDLIMKEKTYDAILKLTMIDTLNTTIIVTHEIESATAIADTILLMGRQFDNDGKSLGSTIVREYDLIERGLAWHTNIQDRPAFQETVREIKNDFLRC